MYDRNVSNGLVSYISDASEITPPDFPQSMAYIYVLEYLKAQEISFFFYNSTDFLNVKVNMLEENNGM